MRTKDTSPGSLRTIAARWYLDGQAATDWLKNNRQILVLAGVDVDMPKSGALAGIETNWEIAQSQKSSKDHLIQTPRGSSDISKVRTDDDGVAKIKVEGTPQRRELDPKKIRPVMKQVRISCTAQAKATDMKQDLVDAVLGAIGIKDGPGLGWLTPVMETMYRMKWEGQSSMSLKVKDWLDAVNIGTVTMEIRVTGSETVSSEGASTTKTITLNRELGTKDAEMDVTGLAFEERPSAAELAALPADIRKSLQEQWDKSGHLFTATCEKPGSVVVKISDKFVTTTRSGRASTTSIENWTGTSTITEMDDGPAGMFEWFMEGDLKKKEMRMYVNGMIPGVVEQIRRVTDEDGTEETSARADHDMGIVFASDLAKDFKWGEAPHLFVLPLKEVKVIDEEREDYYGAASFPVEFNLIKTKLRANLIISYSIQRKFKKKG